MDNLTNLKSILPEEKEKYPKDIESKVIKEILYIHLYILT